MQITEEQYQEIIHTPILKDLWFNRYVKKSWGFHHVTLGFGGRRKLYLTKKNVNSAVNQMLNLQLITKADLKKITWETGNCILLFMAVGKGFMVEVQNG